MLDSILLQIAKNSILANFNTSTPLNKEALFDTYPFLKAKGASFVTLHHNDNLRGCIGSIIAHTNLLEDVMHNANSAAFHDPRFAGLKEEEFRDLTIEVSVLTEAKKVSYKDYEELKKRIRPNVDGLILQYHSNRGTFLPQVWEQLPTPELFLEHLSYKAGMTPEVYNNHPDIYVYQVEAIEERFDAIPSL
jgi:AmmeMemoRadiSam system protein A